MGYVTSTLLWWGVVAAIAALMVLTLGVLPAMVRGRQERRKTTPVTPDARHELGNIGSCSVCGEPGERFTPAQPNFLCRKHWLIAMPDPLEFERMLTG